MAPPLLLRLKSLEDEDPWIIEQKTFNIMADYLQPDSATSTAMTAAALDTLTPMKRHLLEAERTESPESFMLETWGTFIEIAKQIPSDHPSQMRLVHLVKELTILPLTRVPIWGSVARIWTDLPLLGAAFREAWNEPLEEDDTLEPFQHWVNLNSFAARLLDSGLTDWTHFAVWSMRAALEQSQIPARDLWDYRIFAAAQWIEQSGLTLFKKLSDEELNEDEAKVLAGGPLYHGRVGLCSERWYFWRGRFRQVARLAGSEEVRNVAVRAANRMEAVERQGAAVA